MMEAEEAPATTRSPFAGSKVATFGEQVENLAAPRSWLLHAWPEADEPTEDPVVTATLPVPEGLALETHLALAGATPGKWRVQLVPTVKRPAARHRLDRLQKLGPVAGIVTIEPAHVEEARELRPQRRAARRVAGEGIETAAQRSPSVRAMREQVELKRAENERAQLDLEAKRIEKQLRELESDEPKPASPFAGIAAIASPFVPLVIEAVRSFIQNQQQTAAALAEALTREPHYPAPVAQPQGITLETVLGLVPQLKDLAKLVTGLAGGSKRDDDEPRSEIGSMLETVRDILTGVRGDAIAPAAPPAIVPPAIPGAPPVANGHPQQQRRTPQQMMSLRVVKFLSAVLAEQTATADPASAAQRLFPAIGALPEEFRRLILTAGNVEALLAGLPKWLPAALRVQVPNAIRQDQGKQRWLAVFLETVRAIAADAMAQADGDDGDDGEGDEDYATPFDGNEAG